MGGTPDEIVLELGTVDLQREVVRLDTGEQRGLTTKEAAVLRHLAARPDRPVSRDELHAEVWGYAPEVLSRAADNTVRRLRKKIEVDPADPRHVITVHGEGYRFVPTARAAVAPPADLFGRDEALRAVLTRLRARAVVTLRGPGGIGKTRLAHAALARLGGVFVDLAEAREGADVGAAVARRLGVPGGEPAVVAALQDAGHPCLVLDNCEQVADGVARWCRRMGAAGVTTPLLLTSRVELGLSRERVVIVEPLDPEAAVALLVARLEKRGLGWAAGAEGLSRLVERLEGVPLALELAASRVGVLGVEDVVDRLERSLELLVRDPAHRHGALRATLDWSWSLLPESARRALAQSTVFPGSFTADAAEQVLDVPLDVLELLRQHSLLTPSPQPDGRVRLAILDVVRQFAAEHLGADDGVFARHARWAGALPAAAHLREHANLLVAHRWAEGHDPALAVHLAEAMGPGFRAYGPPERWLALVERTAQLPLDPVPRATARLLALETRHALGRVHDTAELDRVDAEARAAGATNLRARVALDRGRWLRAAGSLEEAVRAYRAGLALEPVAVLAGHIHFDLGALAAERMAHADAQAHYREALAAYDAEAPYAASRAELHLALVLCEIGALDEARERAGRVLAELVGRGDRGGEGVVRAHLGLMDLERGALSDAASQVERALVCHRSVGARRFEGYGRLLRAMIFQERGQLARAEQEAGQAAAIFAQVADTRFEAFARARRGVARALRGQAVPARSDLEAARAGLAQRGDALSLAGLDVLIGFVELAEDDEAAARERLAAADADAPSSFVRIAVRQLEAALTPGASQGG